MSNSSHKLKTCVFSLTVNIKNPNIDFNWDMIEEIESGERDDIPCGFFTDEEIIVIANYNPKSNDIEYDEPEVSRAIQAYNNGDMSR